MQIKTAGPSTTSREIEWPSRSPRNAGQADSKKACLTSDEERLNLL